MFRHSPGRKRSRKENTQQRQSLSSTGGNGLRGKGLFKTGAGTGEIGVERISKLYFNRYLKLEACFLG
jgi:hypothetical protein